MRSPMKFLSPRQVRCLAIPLFMFVGIVQAAPVGEAGRNPVPKAVATMRLVKLQSGEEARASINRLHGKQLAFREGHIAEYGDNQKRATVWIAAFETEKAATKELAKMAEGIKKGSGAEVLWLAVDSSEARTAIRDLLGQYPE